MEPTGLPPTLGYAERVNISILVLAAGRGTRFGGPTPKVFVPCGARTVLELAFERLRHAFADAPIALALHPDDQQAHLPPLRRALDALGLTRVVDGGRTRQESMVRAFDAAQPAANAVVAIHDGARPLFSIDAARAAAEAAHRDGAALLATPCADTLKLATESRRVERTLSREGVWRALTPQFVRADVLRRAIDHAAATAFDGTDDVSLVEHLGEPVTVVADSARNLKITSAEDLLVARALIEAGGA